jgi:uncharacterized protein YicC (UPF0701 family)
VRWLNREGDAGPLAKMSPPHLPVHAASLQELLQAKQDLQDLLIAKEEQEDLLRKRERELTALKGALKDEVASHDQEMDKLKEQYDAELQALRESVEEATKVSPPFQSCRPWGMSGWTRESGLGTNNTHLSQS